MDHLEILKVVVLGHDAVARTLCHIFAHLENKRIVYTPRNTTLTTILLPAENNSTEERTIEVFQRGGLDNPSLLQLEFRQANAFVITFSMNSRESFGSIGKFMNESVKHSPKALVGMMETEHKLVVKPDEAAKRAAELGTRFFLVRRRRPDQVKAILAYLSHCNINRTLTENIGGIQTWLEKIRIWFRQTVWNRASSWIIWTCFKRQQFDIESLRGTRSQFSETTTVYGSEAQLVADSKHQHRRLLMSSVRTTIVTRGEHHFYYDDKQDRYFLMLEDSNDVSLLETFRHRVPWQVSCSLGKCSSEEFLQLAQNWPSGHPSRQGRPALYDTFRDIFRSELQKVIDDFPIHKRVCTECKKMRCPELYRLMFMLLQDKVGSTIRVRIDNHELVSADGTTTSDFLLTSVQLPQESEILLAFNNELDERTYAIGWADLWRLNSLGVYLTVPRDVTEHLSLWSEYPV